MTPRGEKRRVGDETVVSQAVGLANIRRERSELRFFDERSEEDF